MLLEEHGIKFVQTGSDFDEDTIATKDPFEFVKIATRGKFEDLKNKYGLDTPLLVADTVVTACGELLRKPKGVEDAKRILQLQSGSQTSIITCFIYATSQKEIEDVSVTTYHFASFEPKDLQEYLESGEWDGKAGGCMVEGFCKKYIVKVDGYESTAMGLSMEKLLPLL